MGIPNPEFSKISKFTPKSPLIIMGFKKIRAFGASSIYMGVYIYGGPKSRIFKIFKIYIYGDLYIWGSTTVAVLY